MEKKKKLLSTICLSALFALALGACDELEDFLEDLEGTDEAEPEIVDTTIHVSGVSLTSETRLLSIGESAKLSATLTPADTDYKEVSWALEDGSSAVTLDVSGLEATVTGVDAGSATISVTTSDGGYKASTEIRVLSEEETISNYQVTFELGEGVEIPSYAELYVSVDGIGAFKLDEDEEGTYSAYIGMEAIGETLTYSVYLVYNESFRAIANCPEATTENKVTLENGSHTISETCEEEGATDTITEVPSLASPYEETYDEVNLEVTIYSDETYLTPVEAPNEYDVYIEWTTDNWETTHEASVGEEGKLSLVSGSTYSVTLSEKGAFSAGGSVSYRLYYEESMAGTAGESITHTTQLAVSSFTVPYFYSGSVISANYCDHGFSEKLDTIYGGTQFYVLVIDDGTSEDSTYEDLDDVYTFFSDEGCFYGVDTNVSDYCVGQKGITVISETPCIYTETYGTLLKEGSDTLYVSGLGSLDLTISVSGVPTKASEGYAVYVVKADLFSSDEQTITEGTWCNGVSDFSALLGEYVAPDDDPYMEGSDDSSNPEPDDEENNG